MLLTTVLHIPNKEEMSMDNMEAGVDITICGISLHELCMVKGEEDYIHRLTFRSSEVTCDKCIFVRLKSL